MSLLVGLHGEPLGTDDSGPGTAPEAVSARGEPARVDGGSEGSDEPSTVGAADTPSDPTSSPEASGEPPAPPAPGGLSPEGNLNYAVRLFYQAMTKRAPMEEIVGALETALQSLAELHRQRFPDFAPQNGVDYVIHYAAPPAPDKPPAVLIEDQTQMGAALGQLWNNYQEEIEYVALKNQVAYLTEGLNQLASDFQKFQNQLDNAMLDFNAIRRKIKA